MQGRDEQSVHLLSAPATLRGGTSNGAALDSYLAPLGLIGQKECMELGLRSAQSDSAQEFKVRWPLYPHVVSMRSHHFFAKSESALM